MESNDKCIQPRTSADERGKLPRLERGDTTGRIINAFYHVYGTLGYGYLESVYRNAFAMTLRKRGFDVITEGELTVNFEGEIVGSFRADLLVDLSIVLELKTAKAIDPAHEAQLLNYLKTSGLELGFVFNFGPKPTFSRRAFTHPGRR
ncbi:MAG: uncharacterized protein JWO05_3890 [Gemmatimonadetes bacterium]|nr:uncharacterized protein [Gemmatimonadota bacterium]